MKHRNFILLVLLALHAPNIGAQGQAVETVKVVSQTVDRVIKLPGEFLPYESVALQARTAGYVEQVLVDRGSAVKKGQLLIKLSAPEMAAQVAEAESKQQQAESQRVEAEAQLASEQSAYDRLKTASATPGAISGLELVQSQKRVDGANALVRSRASAVQAAQATVQAAKAMQQYLNVYAPFSGVVTERFVHPGALVGPGNGAPEGLLQLQQVSRLRLIVAVPEANVAAISRGGRVEFTVPAFPARTFTGVVARAAHALDPKTRTMSVELDVQNTSGLLSPGMYPEVSWPIHSQGPVLLAPPSTIVTTTERTFVIRVANGRAEWVNVKRGAPAGELVQVLGALQPGDLLVQRGTDEIRDKSAVQVKKGS